MNIVKNSNDVRLNIILNSLSIIILLSSGLDTLLGLGSFVTIFYLASGLYFLIRISTFKIFVNSFICLYSIFLTIILFSFYSSSLLHNLDEYYFLNVRMHVFVLVHLIVICDIYMRLKTSTFYVYLYYSFIFVTMFGFLDFVSSNFLGFQFDNIIPRSTMQYNSGNLGGIIRARSTFRESGYYAFYLNTMFWLIFFHLDRFKRNVLLTTYVISLTITFSVAGYAVAIFLLVYKLLIFKRGLIKKVFVSLFFISLILFVFDNHNKIENNKFQLLVAKVTFDESSVSASERLSKYQSIDIYIGDYLDRVSTIFFGLGGSYFKESDGNVGILYLSYLLEYGLLVFIFFSFICIASFYMSYNAAKKNKIFLGTHLSVNATLLHFFIVQSVFSVYALYSFIITFSIYTLKKYSSKVR